MDAARRRRRRRIIVLAPLGCVAALTAAAVLLGPGTEAAHAAGDLLLDPDERTSQRAGGTWSAMFDPGDLPNRLPLLAWGACLMLVGLLGMPYAWLACASLPDRGYAIARPLGLLLVAWPAWLLASVDATAFSRTAIWAVVAAVAAGSLTIAVLCRGAFVAWLRSAVRVIVAVETVFWLAFGAALLVRWLNPDLWHPSLGGEKPMDFAYLNAVVKSTEFPPFDPWFAGGYINYYYFGFVVVAVLIKLTTIVPHVAYNLAVPTLAGLLASSAFGAALALVGEGRRATKRLLGSAALAAVFVAVIGNLGELDVVYRELRGTVRLDWWYWNASRVIEHPVAEPGPITEFPAFTFLYADLHAHAMALPFTAVAIVLAAAWLRGPFDGWPGEVARALLLALVLGTLWTTNTWDLPTYAALALIVLLLAAWTAAPGRRLRATAGALARWGLVVAIAYALFLPFHLHYRSAFEGVERWPGSRTSLEDYLTVHGFFLFLIVAALVVDLLASSDLNAVARTVRLALRRPRRLVALHRRLVSPSPAYLAGCVSVAIGAAFAVVLAVAGEHVLALIALLAALTALLAVRRRPAPLWQATLLFVLVGLALTAAVELVVVQAIDIGRTNTVFKTYLQVWVLWGLAAAVAAHRVYVRLPRLRRSLRIAWRTGFVVLFAATLLYPVLAAWAKVDDRFDRGAGRSLDGTIFMRRATYGVNDQTIPLAPDLEALRWMLRELDGSPVIGEVNTYPLLYGWGNRYAMFTGNPAVVGWDYHQRQQRSIAAPEAVPTRIADIQRAYATADPREAARVFERYDVAYFVVGPLERALYPRGQRKWPGGIGTLWEVAYRNAGVQIYRMLAGP